MSLEDAAAPAVPLREDAAVAAVHLSEDAARFAVRPLEMGDVTATAEFLNVCWRAAYEGILDSGFLSRMTTKTRADILQHRLSGKMRGLLALDSDETLLGLVLFGPTHLYILKDAGEISAIYVAPDQIGTGLGHRLLLLAEAELRLDGHPNVELDVFRANARAIRFYRAHGYTKVGTKTDHIEDHTYELDIMAKRLPA